jgi:hypothetical protein
MQSWFSLPFSPFTVAAALGFFALGCGPAIAGGQPAAGPEQDAPERPEDQLAIVQASHAGAQTFVSLAAARVPVRAAGVAGFTTAEVAAPTTGPVIEGPVMGHDPQVAAGDRFLIVYGAHKYQVFDKATGHPLPSEPGDVVAPIGDFNTIFAPVWHPRDRDGAPNAQNINTRLRFGATDRLACDHETPLRSNACVQEFYDTRILWDEQRKRFWIESAARNHLWFCGKNDDCDEEKENTTQTRTQARRYIAIAVSRTEDPRQGFHHYVLVEEYADWPKLAINDHYLVLSHRTSPNIYVFDADRLAAGNPDHGPVRVAKLGARAFPGAKWFAPVTHHGPTNGVTWLLGSDGSNGVVPFGLYNPDPTRAARPIVIRGPRVEMGAKVYTLSQNAVFRNGFLYFVRDEWAPGHEKEYRDLRVARMPLRLTGTQPPGAWASAEAQHGFLETVIGGREPDDAPGDVVDYEMPAMDVNGAGDMVVVYSRKGFHTAAELPPEVRYSIVYHGEQRARPGVLVRRGTTTAVPDINDNGKAGIDLAYAQVDPSDDRTVWITNAYADAKARWYRQVVAAVKP